MKGATVSTALSRPPRVVAEQILWLRRDIETTPMHVLKLVYICHGWVLGLTDQPLVEEPVEAWRYGPVVPSIYRRYKSFGRDCITTVPIDRSEMLGEQQREFIEVVEEVYRDYSALELSSLTHQPDTPWDTTRRKYGIGAIIPNELIRGNIVASFSARSGPSRHG
jgi:uncharacterized phage-associated protein